MLKIAVINPEKADGLARTIIDGLYQMSLNGEIDFCLSTKFQYNLPVDNKVVPRKDFIGFALNADLIFLIVNAKYGFDKKLAESINRWDKTIYIDGSEAGRNRRYDFTIQKEILDGEHSNNGMVNREMLRKCSLYFKREKPYLKGIDPLPFGIETQYVKKYTEEIKKDIDFVCIFGQDEYPLMRRYTRELVEKYCAENNFTCFTQKTKTPEEFYDILSRAKVGVSVGGGGFDTLRFWEILGNNCLLLTERIDIYEPDSMRLDYKRIWQFNNLFDFQYQLEKMGEYLKSEYNQNNLSDEYKKILAEHSSVARVRLILGRAKEKEIIK
jgi:hypothetical protein